jgi:hypothetical protein
VEFIRQVQSFVGNPSIEFESSCMAPHMAPKCFNGPYDSKCKKLGTRYSTTSISNSDFVEESSSRLQSLRKVPRYHGTKVLLEVLSQLFGSMSCKLRDP